jgi:hypothetical protein
MKIRGEDSAEGVRAWVRDEISKGPTSRYELGRFLFAVSSGTAATVLALEKLSTDPQLDCWLTAALGLLVISVLVSLRLAIPVLIELDPSADLFELHKKQIQRVRSLAFSWAAVWLLSLPFCVAALL